VKRVTTADKKRVTKADVRFCVRDIRPFNTVVGKDFMYDTVVKVIVTFLVTVMVKVFYYTFP